MCAAVPTAGDDPAADRSGPVDGSPVPESMTGETSSDPVAHGLRILLAEDDTMVARSTVAVLRRLGHSITHVHDGSTAWKCLQEGMHEFDALLIDVVLPRMSGSDLAHRARAAGFAGRIVMVSGFVMAMDPDMLKRLCIGAFMTKPFLPADLDRALRGKG